MILYRKALKIRWLMENAGAVQVFTQQLPVVAGGVRGGGHPIARFL
jgi:hypothetical protein